MKYAVWFWVAGHPPENPWFRQLFACECKAATWISSQADMRFLHRAHGKMVEAKSVDDIPVNPPEDSTLLLGDQSNTNWQRAGRYPI